MAPTPRLLPALLLLCGLSCATTEDAGDRGSSARVKLHLGEKWFKMRGQFLGMTAEQAKMRDADLSKETPPSDPFWDEMLATESASIWRALCNQCHGGRRSIASAAKIPSPAPGWGEGQGMFFEKKRPYKEIFATIHDGVEPPAGKKQEMPSWSDKLSIEQIWALVYYIEHETTSVFLRAPK